MVKKIKCLIVDDEPLALELIERYVRQTSFLELTGKCKNAFEALEIIASQPIDLMFLDIQMPDFNGMELSKSVVGGPEIVFTTAYQQYAVDSYKVDALDYLLKPFDYSEFLQAANKAKEWFQLKNNPNTNPGKEFIFVKSEYKQIRISLKEVLYFEGLKDYVKIYIEGQPKPVLSLMSLKTLEEQLLAENFMRVHRSFIINLNKIEAVERGQIIINKYPVTVAENYKDKFREYLLSKSI